MNTSSNVSLTGNTTNKTSNLNRIFDSMAYEESGETDLSSIKNWLVKGLNKVLSSRVNNEVLLGDDSVVRAIRMELFGTDIQARLLDKTDAVIAAYKRVYEKEGAIAALNNETRLDRKSKLQDLIKSRGKDLVQLEACAGKVPLSQIQKNDMPKWLSNASSSVSTEIRRQIEIDQAQILLRVNIDSYCLTNIIAVLSALVQTDGPVVVFIVPNQDSSIFQLLPVIYLIDAINNLKIRNQPIDVLLLTSNLLNAGSFQQLSLADKSLKHSKAIRVVEIGSPLSGFSQTVLACSAALNPASKNGRSVHYVIDSSADISSAISSMSRNAWFSGMEINHRCRSLAFVHQSAYVQVVTELKNVVENIKVKGWESSYGANCDFVSKPINSATNLLSINQLGAKILSIKLDYTVPTVVYDIGTSSDLAAMKESGLGHILVLIPYRASAELVSLGNNFGVPDQVFLYSNCISTSMDLMKKLNASEILVNSASLSTKERLSPLDLPWQVVNKSDIGKERKVAKGEKLQNIKLETNSSKWRDLSTGSKVEKLREVVKAFGKDPEIVSTLLSHYVDATRTGSMTFGTQNDNTVSGIILTDANAMEKSTFLTALIACALRDKPIVVLSLASAQRETNDILKAHLPGGLVSLEVVPRGVNIEPLTKNWDLVWIFQSNDFVLDDLIGFTASSENKILLVNHGNDKKPEFNAKLAIASGCKNVYI